MAEYTACAFVPFPFRSALNVWYAAFAVSSDIRFFAYTQFFWIRFA